MRFLCVASEKRGEEERVSGGREPRTRHGRLCPVPVPHLYFTETNDESREDRGAMNVVRLSGDSRTADTGDNFHTLPVTGASKGVGEGKQHNHLIQIPE